MEICDFEQQKHLEQTRDNPLNITINKSIPLMKCSATTRLLPSHQTRFFMKHSAMIRWTEKPNVRQQNSSNRSQAGLAVP